MNLRKRSTCVPVKRTRQGIAYRPVLIEYAPEGVEFGNLSESLSITSWYVVDGIEFGVGLPSCEMRVHDRDVIDSTCIRIYEKGSTKIVDHEVLALR